MTGAVYLASLLAALTGMLLLDRRFGLFFWRDARSASIVTVVGLLFFLSWDAAGIAGGIFLRGDAAIATGIVLAPELPLEEPVFLLFLVVCTMVVYTGSARIIGALRARRPTGGATGGAE
ncbi:lycopene cyclase domain-containing protein [Streptomyces sp. AC495_CC817]|uniref:lycopene cyclase domain-containing protein n=1 Tax=Streptomyces sp. AC495_CC817 TaxID=2823900 RepID=UPI001C273937|nr:lycopene cyclase domain-containing protein [Streptomyces sp. AC495_CC817]